MLKSCPITKDRTAPPKACHNSPLLGFLAPVAERGLIRRNSSPKITLRVKQAGMGFLGGTNR